MSITLKFFSEWNIHEHVMSDQRYTLIRVKKITSLVSVKQKIVTLYKAYLFSFQKHKRSSLLFIFFKSGSLIHWPENVQNLFIYQDLDYNIFSLTLSIFPNKLFYLKASRHSRCALKYLLNFIEFRQTELRNTMLWLWLQWAH